MIVTRAYGHEIDMDHYLGWAGLAGIGCKHKYE
jgi:hypothetical protein